MTETYNDNGLILSLGTLVRPRDEAEDKHKRVLFAPPPSTADLSTPVSLVTPANDPRAAVFYQASIGSCAACSSAKAVESGFNYRNPGRERAQGINPGPLYTQSRIKQGWFPNDSGSYVADNLDQLLVGAPLLGNYVDNASEPYMGYVWDTAADYEFSHQPFYPSGGSFLEHIWLSIRDGLPVVLASSWPNEWFRPTAGRIPSSVRQFTAVGHAYWVWAVVPGFVLCRNSWSTGWSADAAQFGFNMQAGDFAIPFEYFNLPNGGPFWEGRTISPEMITTPKPEPPKPDPPKPDPPKPLPPDPPKPEPVKVSFEGTVQKFKSGGTVLITPDRFTQDLFALVNKRVRVTEI